MQYLKHLTYLFPMFVANIFLSIVLRNYKNGQIEKKVRNSPLYNVHTNRRSESLFRMSWV